MTRNVDELASPVPRSDLPSFDAHRSQRRDHSADRDHPTNPSGLAAPHQGRSLMSAGPPHPLRVKARDALFRLIARVNATDDAHDMVAGHLRDLEARCAVPGVLRTGVTAPAWPYDDVAATADPPGPRLRADTIIVTGRFRSGSTLWWNLFRQATGTTSYYEPFNERRWFDADARGNRIDSTHRGVDDYWREYDGLDELGRYYDESWIGRRIYMSAEAYHPAMLAYVETLIARAHGRAVLQFNRIDFRLPWFRAWFPNAPIVHIYRHPRDQWCSTLAGAAFGPERRLDEFQPFDAFYLRLWAEDLKHYFPFLTLDPGAHPYELFFEIWRLSLIFGQAYADVSVAFEALLDDPAGVITRVFDACRLPIDDLGRLTALVEPVGTGAWRRYADDPWFSAIERRVNRRFEDYLGVVAAAAAPLKIT